MKRLSGLAAALVLLVAGCGGAEGSAGAGGKVDVITSTNVWGSVVRAVGGDAVSVQSLITSSGGDPHAYEDKPQDAVAIARADLLVANGGGYDDFFTRLADGSGTKARRIDAYEVSGHGAKGGPDADDNEHVWYDLPTVKEVADKIAVELGAVDSADKGEFAANARSFGAKLDQLATKVARIGRADPGAKVVATEPVAHYLLKTAGVGDATPSAFSEAIEEETDPPAAAVAAITDLIKKKRVDALINNEQTETPMTNSLADAAAKAGLPVVGVRETLPPKVTDYVEWMTKQVDELTNALANA